jgi:hypothetical protein
MNDPMRAVDQLQIGVVDTSSEIIRLRRDENATQPSSGSPTASSSLRKRVLCS